MRKVTLFYLFFQTLALLMLLSILSGRPDSNLLSDYERFGYATAAFGIAFMLSLLVRKYFSAYIDTFRQVILIIGLYPILLYLVHTAVTSSPELIAAENRPAAMQQGVKMLSGKKLANADFHTKFNALSTRFPVPDEQIRLLYLESIQALSELIQHKNLWSKDLTEEQLKKARTGLYFKNNYYSKYENRLGASYLFSMMSGVMFPLNSRTLPQVGQLSRIGKEQLNAFHVELIEALMQGLKLLRYVFPSAELADAARTKKYWREDFIRTKRMLLQFEQKIKAEQGFQDFKILPHKFGLTFEETVKRSLTAHILIQAGISTANIPEGLMLPLRTEGLPYQADTELTELIRWLAPYMFNQHGKLIVSIAHLGNPERVQGYKQHLSAELPAALKDNFNRFYNRTAADLATNASAWKSPIAMELYGHYLRIGKILPWLILLSFILLTANFVRVARRGIKATILASITVVSAFFIFLSSLLPWIITPVLWVSI